MPDTATAPAPAPAPTAPAIEPLKKRMIETDRQVCLIRFSPDGRYLFGGGFDASIRRWDITPESVPVAEAAEADKGTETETAIERDTQLEPLTGHDGWVQTLCFTPDGGMLFTADSWGQVRGWNVDGDKVTSAWAIKTAHDGWVRALAVSPDGQTLVSAGVDRTIRFWSTADGKPGRELAGHVDDVFCLEFHPDGQSLVSADFLGHLKHWNVDTGACEREMRIEKMHLYERIQDVAGIRILSFDESGETLLVAGSEPARAGRMIGIPTIRLLNWESLETEKTWHLGGSNNGYVFDLTRHPDGYFIIATSGTPGTGQFMLLRPEEDEPFYTHTKIANCHSLALHPDNRTAIVATINPRNQGNGAVRDKEGNYIGNWTPLHVFDLSPPVAAAESG